MSEDNAVTNDLKRQAAMFYNSTESSSWRFWQKRRLVVALLAFLGFFNVYALRVNLSVAVVAMTEPVETELENGTIVPEFDWSSQTKGLVLSSFFYGYLITQLPGGWLAAKIGGNRMFAIGVGATSLFTLFTPPLAHTSTSLLIAVRVIEGLFERARLATFAFSGSYVGTVVVDRLSVDDSVVACGEGETRGGRCTSGLSVTSHPWRAMLTSRPVWAIVVAHFAENWGFYTLLTSRHRRRAGCRRCRTWPWRWCCRCRVTWPTGSWCWASPRGPMCASGSPVAHDLYRGGRVRQHRLCVCGVSHHRL
ncbi:unnamed protein product [Leptidea sinapis]|uniref:Major facilitator superfamily (MFS) profile domain-containing protein n=1 Tax=Leptidea sinapis TaxID=189913 RepID=A0A5E4Q539_9NEOP|nr:unnamed protein product [Leptidea sinapis]